MRPEQLKQEQQAFDAWILQFLRENETNLKQQFSSAQMGYIITTIAKKAWLARAEQSVVV
jgi:hypothetical protein|nr:MAG TPA: hypothetical protein [Caudoviricetes sp.]